MTTTEKIPNERIRTDGGTQPRAAIHVETCREYAEAMESGEHFPAVEVYFDGEHYWLADGFHRLFAHRKARPGEPIECVVYQGTLEDAQWHSYGVNKAHGLRRTNRDKERAVKAALSHLKADELSNVQIAEHCGVDEKTVRKYRQQLRSTSEFPKSRAPSTTTLSQSHDGVSLENVSRTKEQRPRTGRDGRTINTANIGKRTAKRNGKRRVTVYSSAQAREAIQQGQRVRFSSFVKLELPTNHAANCAYDLLQFLPFEYLQKVFQEIVRIHQERLQKETSQ